MYVSTPIQDRRFVRFKNHYFLSELKTCVSTHKGGGDNFETKLPKVRYMSRIFLFFLQGLINSLLELGGSIVCDQLTPRLTTTSLQHQHCDSAKGG